MGGKSETKAPCVMGAPPSKTMSDTTSGGGDGGGSSGGGANATLREETKAPAPDAASNDAALREAVKSAAVAAESAARQAREVAEEKRKDDALDAQLTKIGKTAHYSGGMARDDVGHLLTILYGASAQFSYCENRRRVALWHRAAQMALGALADLERPASRGMAMMFHPTNGRTLFEWLEPFPPPPPPSAETSDHNSRQERRPGPSLSPSLSSPPPPKPPSPTVAWTPAIEAVMVELVAKQVLRAAIGVDERAFGDTVARALESVLADHGISDAIPTDDLARLQRAVAVASLSAPGS